MQNNDLEATINVLVEKQTIKTLSAHITRLEARIEELERNQQLTSTSSTEASSPIAPRPSRIVQRTGRKPRDYGPDSVRKATDEDAYEIRFGEYRHEKARYIADVTGLSRGQVYSIQGNYTFRHIDESFTPNTTHTYVVGEAHVDIDKLHELNQNFVGPLQH